MDNTEGIALKMDRLRQGFKEQLRSLGNVNSCLNTIPYSWDSVTRLFDESVLFTYFTSLHFIHLNSGLEMENATTFKGFVKKSEMENVTTDKGSLKKCDFGLCVVCHGNMGVNVA